MKGFSLVEFIMVIVLLGVVSAVVIPRFLTPDPFNAVAAQDGLLTVIRSAQQVALGRSNVTFQIEQGGGDWIFTSRAGSNIVQNFEISATNISLETGSAAVSANNCSSVSGFNDPVVDLVLAFNGKGDLTSFTNDGDLETVDASFNGVRICVNDTVENSVCVSPAGYAYAGNCDD